MTRERTQPPKDDGSIGHEENNPYANDDLTSYPAWWREHIVHFEEFDMRPYRPPRLKDGELVPEAIQELEAEFDVTIRFRSLCPELGDDWELWVNSVPVKTVERYRDGNGYTVYLLEKDDLREIIRDCEYTG